MGSVYKRGKIYYIDTRINGRRIRKRIGTSKRLAELALHDVEVKAAKQELGFENKDIGIAEFFDRYLEYSATNNRSSSTERYRAVLDNFGVFLESRLEVRNISDVTAETIDSYIIYRRNSTVNDNGVKGHPGKGPTEKTKRVPKANTINFELDTLRLVFNVAKKWGYIQVNPVVGIRRLKVEDSGSIRFLKIEECERFLDNCPDDLYVIYLTFLNTGMRKAEIENLQWDDVDLRRGVISIRFKKTWNPKSGERDIPMNDILSDNLSILKRRRGKIV